MISGKDVAIQGNGHSISMHYTKTDGANSASRILAVYSKTLILDNVKLNITGNANGVSGETQNIKMGDGIVLAGTYLTLQNGTEVHLDTLNRGFVMELGQISSIEDRVAKVIIDNSKMTVENISGNASNGAHWEVLNGAELTVKDIGTHGLSTDTLLVDNATVSVDGAGWLGIYGTDISLKNNANVSVVNSGTSEAFAASPSYTGKGAVQLKGSTPQLSIEDSTLTLEDNGNGAVENEQTIYVGNGSLDISNSSVNGQIRQDENATTFLVTVMDRGTVVEQKTVSGSYTLPAAPAAPSGYTFANWLGSDGKTYAANAEVSNITANMTFTAQWQQIPSTPDTPSYDGGSSEPSGDYIVSVDRVSGGKVTVNPGRADRGDEVTVTVKPNDGYELDELVVTDSRGNELKLSYEGSGKYTFTMPSGTVDVKATFVKTDAGSVLDDFADVNPNAWYAQAVEFVVEEGLMTGTSATTFAPDTSMSRAMIWTVLAAYNSYNTSGGNPWYAPGQQWAMVNGVSDGTAPNGSITREQLAVMLWRAAGSPETSKSLSGYADASSVSDWAVEALAWAVDNGIISGMGGSTLAPQATATRAQVAVMLMQFVDYMEA